MSRTSRNTRTRFSSERFAEVSPRMARPVVPQQRAIDDLYRSAGHFSDWGFCCRVVNHITNNQLAQVLPNHIQSCSNHLLRGVLQLPANKIQSSRNASNRGFLVRPLKPRSNDRVQRKSVSRLQNCNNWLRRWPCIVTPR